MMANSTLTKNQIISKVSSVSPIFWTYTYVGKTLLIQWFNCDYKRADSPTTSFSLQALLAVKQMQFGEASILLICLINVFGWFCTPFLVCSFSIYSFLKTSYLSQLNVDF